MTEPAAEDPHEEQQSQSTVSLPGVAWISARDGPRAMGDLEDQAARYHLDRHELKINADFRAITDPIAHWYDRYCGVAGARTVIEGQVREWCEQILVEVVLAARNSSWSPEQLDALVSPTSLTAALLPRTYCAQRFRSASARSSEPHGATQADHQRRRTPQRNLPPGRTTRDLQAERADARRAGGMNPAVPERARRLGAEL